MTAVSTKESMAKMAAEELEELLHIIGSLSYIGYKISMCKLYGNSYQQCANKYNISKAAAQYYYEKCIEKQYDLALKKIFGIK